MYTICICMYIYILLESFGGRVLISRSAGFDQQILWLANSPPTDPPPFGKPIKLHPTDRRGVYKWKGGYIKTNAHIPGKPSG